VKGVDTNFLVRFLTRDDDQQAKVVLTVVRNAESTKERLFVPLIVVLELIWVLESAYRIPRSDIAEAIGDLLLLPVFQFEQAKVVREALVTAASNSYDLSDLLIAHCAQEYGCTTVLTFDKKAGKYPLFEVL
jgi:predicted nucleic-acid-binding protein